MLRSHKDVAAIAREGLAPGASAPRRIIIVGAGIAGLVAAYELMRAGHDPIVLEARPRVGGRIHTLREPFSHGLYAEVGAMRIPKTHDLTIAYCERFGLKLTPFTMGNPNAYVYLQGRRMRMRDVQANPAILSFELAAHEIGSTCDSLWNGAIADLADLVARSGDAGWEDIYRRYDQYSTREFLESKGWSEGAIEMYGLFAFQETLMNSSFLEVLREEVNRCYVDLSEIDGGMDRLPNAFLPHLRQRVHFGARMVALDQSDRGVIVHYKTAAGRFSITGDYAIVTVPFPVLRHVEAIKPFSPGQAAGDPGAALRRVRQDPLPVPAPVLGGGRWDLWRGDGERSADSRDVLSGSRPRDRPRRHARELHVVGGCPALGIALACRPDRRSARRRGADPSAGCRRVRGRRILHVARR